MFCSDLPSHTSLRFPGSLKKVDMWLPSEGLLLYQPPWPLPLEPAAQPLPFSGAIDHTSATLYKFFMKTAWQLK